MWAIELSFDVWFKACVPTSVRAQLDRPKDGYSMVHMDKDLPPHEKDLYPGIRDGLNELLTQIGSELVIYCNTKGPHRLTAAPHKTLPPNMGLYIRNSQARDAYSAGPPPQVCSDHSAATEAPDAPDKAPSSTPAPNHFSAEDKARMAWASVEIVIEVKRADKRGPDAGAGGVQIRGRLIHYAIKVYNLQHRTHIFMISIVGHTARLLYMDRVAVLVSKPFNYVENPVKLGMFLHAYSEMTREQRGFDSTASLASPDEVKLFRSLASTADLASAVGRGLKWAATPGWPVFALDIFAPWSDPDTFLDGTATTQLTTHRCLVGRPAFETHSLEGRGTRCFVAYDKAEEKVLYIKDSWRPISVHITSEFENYQILLGKLGRDGLQDNFLTLRAGGDVLWRAPGDDVDGTQARTQRTFTQELLDVALPDRPPPMQHARLVFKEVCRSLEEFEDARQLLDVVGFVLHAHKDAWEIAGLLHRDLSVGNILIHDCEDSSYRAILADWESAKTREQLLPGNQRATQPGETLGTWQFKSAVLQCCPGKVWEVSDDLESIFHVLNLCSLKYLRHSLTGHKETLTLNVHRWYDAPVLTEHSNEWMFSHKFTAVSRGMPFVRGLPDEAVNPLGKLLRTLGELCKMHYASDEMKRFWPEEVPCKAPVSGPAGGSTERIRLSGLQHVHQWDSESDNQPTESGAAAPKSIGKAQQPQPPTSSNAVRVTSPLKDHAQFIEAFKPYLGRAHKPKVRWTRAACEKLNNQLTVLDPHLLAGLGLQGISAHEKLPAQIRRTQVLGGFSRSGLGEGEAGSHSAKSGSMGPVSRNGAERPGAVGRKSLGPRCLADPPLWLPAHLRPRRALPCPCRMGLVHPSCRHLPSQTSAMCSDVANSSDSHLALLSPLDTAHGGDLQGTESDQGKARAVA